MSATATKPERSYVRVYDARLVKLLGAHGAMVLAQIEYLLHLPNSGHDYDDHHWIWKSARELADEVGLSEDQVQRELTRLSVQEYRVDERGIRRGMPKPGFLIRIHHPTKGYDQTYWYRINWDHPAIPQDCGIHSADSRNGNRRFAASNPQERGMQSAALRNPSRRTAEAIPQSTTRENERESTSGEYVRKTTSPHARESTSPHALATDCSTNGVPKLQLSEKPEPAQEPSNGKAAADDDSTPLERQEAGTILTPQERMEAIRERRLQEAAS